MSELISGKEALIALANGVKPSEIEGMFAAGLGDSLYLSIDGKVDLCVKHLNEKLFRLKPRTIIINGIEVPAPFEPKLDDVVYYLTTTKNEGYTWGHFHPSDAQMTQFGAWRTESEIKQVVEALRSVFKTQ